MLNISTGASGARASSRRSRFDAADVRQRNIHDDDVGLPLRATAHSLGRRGRLADYAQIASSFEQPPVPLADDGMVVDKQHADAQASCDLHSR